MFEFMKKLFSAESDEDFEQQKRDFYRVHQSMSALDKNSMPDCDCLPGSYGSFGHSPTNPIPVNGLIGEFFYLSKLRSRSGVGFFYHRIGSVASPVSSNPVDEYEIVAVDNSERHKLFFSLYHHRRSQQVPDGLSATPWGSLNEAQRKLGKLPAFGTNTHVENFPYGLPDAIANHPILNNISPDLAAQMANKAAKMIEANFPSYSNQEDGADKEWYEEDTLSPEEKTGIRELASRIAGLIDTLTYEMFSHPYACIAMHEKLTFSYFALPKTKELPGAASVGGKVISKIYLSEIMEAYEGLKRCKKEGQDATSAECHVITDIFSFITLDKLMSRAKLAA